MHADILLSTRIITLCISHRYTRHCTFQVALLPAKSKISLHEYMKPILQELDVLSKKVMRVRRNGDEVAKAKVFALFINGDGVQINQLMNFAGHNQ